MHSNELNRMIGQMVAIGFRGTEALPDSDIISLIRDKSLGAVWLTDNESPMGKTLGNVKSPQQLRKLITDLQNAAEIPLMIAIDAEGGKVIRLKEKYGFTATHSAYFLGQKNDLNFTFKHSLMIAEMIRDAGVNTNFAPVVDILKDKTNPALAGKERCFSDNVQTVIDHAEQVINANHEAGIACGIKHFPGHGSAGGDSHLGIVDVTNSWEDSELEPYRYFINKNQADAVLIGHLVLQQFDSDFPATLSRNIITGLLREELKYDGVVVTDDMDMGAVKNNYDYATSVEKAINAGVDIILHSNVQHYDPHIAEKTILMIQTLVQEGKVSSNRIRESYERILKLKSKFKTS